MKCQAMQSMRAQGIEVPPELDCPNDADGIDQDNVELCALHHSTKELAYSLMGKSCLPLRPLDTLPPAVGVRLGTLEFLYIICCMNLAMFAFIGADDGFEDAVRQLRRMRNTLGEDALATLTDRLGRLGAAAFPELKMSVDHKLPQET